MTVEKNDARLTVLAVGDLILDAPQPDQYFEHAEQELKKGDVVIGQVEVPHTLRPLWSNAEPHSAPAADPEHLSALKHAGFHIATLAGNHLFDQGANGVEDTLKKLHELGIQTVGGGMNIYEARKPASVEKKGLRVACLQYNTIGPRESWAAPLKAGSAFIRVETHYVNDKADPGGLPSRIYTTVDPATLNDMEQDIAAAKDTHDVVIVGFHMGRPGSPVILQYQTEITRRAIDAGAEAVFACHTHSLLGIEVYRGKPIYHGLGNFVTVTGAMYEGSPSLVQRRYNPFYAPSTVPYINTDPFADLKVTNIPYYPFDEVSRNTMIAKMVLSQTGLVKARLIPCYINDKAQPIPVGRHDGGQQVLDHVIYLTRAAGLNTMFDWTEDGREVAIRT